MKQLMVGLETLLNRRMTMMDSVGMKQYHTQRAGESWVMEFLRLLENECSAYCILGRDDELPERVTSDLDFMVHQQDYDHLAPKMRKMAQACGAQLLLTINHEKTACSYQIASIEDSTVTIFPCDACSDYRRSGVVYLRAAEILARRVYSSRGFWVPAPADAFRYYFLKRIEKQSIKDDQAAYLARLVSEDEKGCQSALQALGWNANPEEVIVDGQFKIDFVRENMQHFHRKIVRPEYRLRVKEMYSEALRIAERIYNRTGLWIAIVGPETQGKTALINSLLPALRPIFADIKLFELDSLHTPICNGKPTSLERVFSAKILYLGLGYLFRYWSKVWGLLLRSRLVIDRRYWHEVFAEYSKLQSSGLQWLLRLVTYVIPQPDIIFLLDVDKEIGKASASFEELSRKEYLNQMVMFNARSQVRLLDASQAAPELYNQAVTEIFCFLESRTQNRLTTGDNKSAMSAKK
jgi:thymidylate kinase